MTRIYVVASYFQGCVTAVSAFIGRADAEKLRDKLNRLNKGVDKSQCSVKLHTVELSDAWKEKTMPTFLVANYYTSSIIHEVEAKDAEAALAIGRDLPDDPKELASAMQYDESMIVQ